MKTPVRAARRLAPSVDALEGRSLLSYVIVYPFGHPDRAHRVYVADVAPSSGGGGTAAPASPTGGGTSGSTTGGGAAGVGQSTGKPIGAATSHAAATHPAHPAHHKVAHPKAR